MRSRSADTVVFYFWLVATIAIVWVSWQICLHAWLFFSDPKSPENFLSLIVLIGGGIGFLFWLDRGKSAQFKADFAYFTDQIKDWLLLLAGLFGVLFFIGFILYSGWRFISMLDEPFHITNGGVVLGALFLWWMYASKNQNRNKR